jgi:hypothetical protein
VLRMPSMIAPALLLIAVLSTSAVKPVEYVRISPSAARPLAQRDRARPNPIERAGGHARSVAGRSGSVQTMPANERGGELGAAIGPRTPAAQELPREIAERVHRLLAVLAGEHVLRDP